MPNQRKPVEELWYEEAMRVFEKEAKATKEWYREQHEWLNNLREEFKKEQCR